MTDALPSVADAVTVATGLGFPEGPVAGADGSLLFVELARRRVSRLTTGGAVEVVASAIAGPNGLAPHGDALVVCDNGGFFEFQELNGLTVPGPTPSGWAGGRLARVDPVAGAVTTLATHTDEGERLQAPNDLVLDGHGGVWFTDHGVRQPDHVPDTANARQPSLLYATLDGSSVRGVVVGLDAANGVGLSPSGHEVYVAETHTGRLWSWPIDAPGRLGRHPGSTEAHGGRLVFDAPDGHLFDSLAVDAAGFVVVGTLGWAGGLTVVDPASGAGEHLALGDPLVTNVAFGGPDRTTAFCTGSGTGIVFTLPWPRPGAALHT